MRTRQWFTFAIACITFASWPGSAYAETFNCVRLISPCTVNFADALAGDRPLEVFTNGDLAKPGKGLSPSPGRVTNEKAQTDTFRSFRGGGGPGLLGVVLFEPGTSVASDFILANVTLTKDVDFFFESDPEILGFNKDPGFKPVSESTLLDALKKLAREDPTTKIEETGSTQEITGLFRNSLGQRVVLPNDIRVFVSSDVEPIPEPSTFLLLGSGLAGVFMFGRRRFLRRA